MELDKIGSRDVQSGRQHSAQVPAATAAPAAADCVCATNRATNSGRLVAVAAVVIVVDLTGGTDRRTPFSTARGG